MTTNIDKLNQSMSDLIDALSFTTKQAVSSNKYEELNLYMETVNAITTNIKRLVDCGVGFDGENLNVKEEGETK